MKSDALPEFYCIIAVLQGFFFKYVVDIPLPRTSFLFYYKNFSIFKFRSVFESEFLKFFIYSLCHGTTLGSQGHRPIGQCRRVLFSNPVLLPKATISLSLISVLSGPEPFRPFLGLLSLPFPAPKLP